VKRLDVAASTDRGQVRERNEDAMLAGETVFAVADGMGGHLAGDVAAATALEPVRALDGRVFPDAATAQAALLDAILAANAAVVRKAADEPGLRGMGTTLTATIVEGRRLHVGHVGDSRAYLIRDGEMTQLTRDHTLVAHLIEEGQITEEEAASHPHRSIITRAIGVDVDLEIDTLTIDLQDGDEVILCSDGLTGPVDDEQIRDVLVAEEDVIAAAEALVELANEHGGPDNITVVLLRYEADPAEQRSIPPTVIRTDRERSDGEGDWAETMGRLGTLARPKRGAPPRPGDESRGLGRIQRTVTVVIVIAGLLVAAALGGRWLLSRSYYVGISDGTVAIYNGVPASLGPLELSWVTEETDVSTLEIPPWYVRNLREGIPAADLADARRIVANAPRTDDDEEPTEPPDEGVWREVRRLPDGQRDAIGLRYGADLSYRDAAAALGCSEAAARQRVRAGLESLRARLEVTR
jgi:PPM family protein phosphatase